MLVFLTAAVRGEVSKRDWHSPPFSEVTLLSQRNGSTCLLGLCSQVAVSHWKPLCVCLKSAFYLTSNTR